MGAMVRLFKEDAGSLRETLGPVKDPIPACPKVFRDAAPNINFSFRH
jgi:hypothetical protein